MAWTPLLTGELATVAHGAAREIALALAAAPIERASERALFWAYASAVFDEPFANDAYNAALDRLVADVTDRRYERLGLSGGLAGCGWTLCHTLSADDMGDALTAVDHALLAVLDPWPGAHDLLEGLVGFGVYFLERIHAGAGDSARHGLAAVVAQLARTAETGDGGARWHTPSRLLPEPLASEFPDGFYDCGLAHGVPGMVAFLDRATPHVDAARPLAEAAARWVMAQRRGRFPGKLIGDHTEPARMAWCYGDPGVALGLYRHDRERAIEIALAAPEDDGRTVDAGLCHGAAGHAHLCNRLYQASGNPVFADRARTWFGRALAMPRPREGGLLEGGEGVGLALLAALTTTEPAWDRLLLCDLPPR